MTQNELWQMFDACGIPVFNTVSEAGTALPYAVMNTSQDRNTAADNKIYSVGLSCTLELYTLQKDYNAMGCIEAILQDNEIPWQHDTSMLDGQKVYMEIYTFTVIVGPVEIPDFMPEIK